MESKQKTLYMSRQKFLKKTKPDGTIETTLIEKRYGKR